MFELSEIKNLPSADTLGHPRALAGATAESHHLSSLGTCTWLGKGTEDLFVFNDGETQVETICH